MNEYKYRSSSNACMLGKQMKCEGIKLMLKAELQDYEEVYWDDMKTNKSDQIYGGVM